MSLLNEILETVDQTERADIIEKAPQIISRINKVKSEVMSHAENYFLTHLPSKKANAAAQHLKEVDGLNDDMQKLMSKINERTKREIEDSTSELTRLTAKLKESSFALQVATQLVNIYNGLQRVNALAKQKDYVEAVRVLKSIEKIINDIPKDERVDILASVSIEVRIKEEEILREASYVWNDCVTWQDQDGDNLKTLIIKISHKTDELQKALEALSLSNKNVAVLNTFTYFLMDCVLTEVINSVVHVCHSDENNFAVLKLEINKPQKKPSYNEVFGSLNVIFEYLDKAFNFSLQNSTVLRYVGNKIEEKFTELLIKNCLADTIPSTQEELKKYQKVIEDTESLQDVFVRTHFFAEDCTSIIEYAKNVDVLFANKTCNTYKEKAREIMKKDLHDMIEVGTPVDPSKDSQSNEFHQCCVSRNVEELLQLVDVILKQTTTSSDLCAGRLFCTACNIVDLYSIFVPEYHKRFLETIPQQVALFYNNCIYISYRLTKLDEVYRNKITNVLDVSMKSFMEQKSNLQKTSSEVFIQYLHTQSKQIEETLKQSGLATIGQKPLDDNTEKLIRQCIRQLELLKTVWSKVLSYYMYNESIGSLFNVFIDKLIALVIGVEDISVSDAKALVEIFQIVLNRGPKLFIDSREINMYVKSWYKFKELELLLNSNLLEINDRWADGKGPLAVEFKPEEVKGLIRALFMNTDRRAAVLAKIN